MAEIALPFPRLGSQNMAGKTMASLYFSTAGLLEALGRAPVGLDLGHLALLLNLLYH